jgi:hypothetical protein
MIRNSLSAIALALVLAPAAAEAQVLLYQQDFEHPVGFVNNGADLSQQPVNTLYAAQPVGFVFSQANTVETLRIGGTLAFGQGYSDPSGAFGQYTLGMLSSVQDDRLGLAFNVGSFDFLNVRVDFSQIDLSCCGAPFVPDSNPPAPIFRFSLFNNPLGLPGLGSGPVLDSFDAAGSPNATNRILSFSQALGGLDATGSTNGNVILQLDLLQGGYAAFDNIRVVASNREGQVELGVPEPAAWALLIMGFGAVGGALRRRLAVT